MFLESGRQDSNLRPSAPKALGSKKNAMRKILEKACNSLFTGAYLKTKG